MPELSAWGPSGPGPRTELMVRRDPSHPVTQRLDPEWKSGDRLYLSEGPPLDASILLRTTWRYTEQAAAYERRFGEGRVVYLGLHNDGSQTFEKLIGRLVLFAAGRTAGPPVGVGLVGYGAIGPDHPASFTATRGVRLAGRCGMSPQRREAESGDGSVRVVAQRAPLRD